MIVRPAASLVALLAMTALASSAAAGGDAPPVAPPAAERAEAPAPDPCVVAIAARIQSRYESIHDLTARFEQVTRSVAFGGRPAPGEVPARGVVVFAKPGRMRWSYEEPAPSLMVSDGVSLWLHDPVAGEASRTSVEQGAGSGAALQFLMGEGSLLDEFSVTAEGCSLEVERVDLDLVPLRPATYERMGLIADPRSGEIVATHVVDLFGNVTRISFSEVKYDVSPEDDLFVFVPPAGTDVVDLLAPP